VRYTARVVPADEQPACTSGGGGTPAGGTALTATLPVAQGSRSRVAVVADNGWHCSVSLSDPVFGTPASPDASAATIAAVVRDDALDVQLTTAPATSSGTWLEARVRSGAADGPWQRAGAGSWLTPAGPSFQYGSAVAVELRACAPGAGSGGVCSSPSRVGGSVTPLALRASVAECRPLQPLSATVPGNATPLARGEVVASYLVGGSWTGERPATEPVPAGATQVRAWGVVTYLESGPFKDLFPTEAGCGL
ncbi:hypothetical protein, partial [Agrococcus sp. HG114]|uniref:hypothetical protein n=1 Tax=Agrococcus sp. HG114 TaxID=2969757 RepID=UPI00215B6B2B